MLIFVLFPPILKGATVNKLILSAIILSFSFILTLFIGLSIPFLVVFLLAMAVWGIYYEYLHFAQAQFVADTAALKLRATSWGIIADRISLLTVAPFNICGKIISAPKPTNEEKLITNPILKALPSESCKKLGTQ